MIYNGNLLIFRRFYANRTDFAVCLIFYFPSIVIKFKLCYTIFATQLNIWTNYRRGVFNFGKNTFSILAFSCSLSEVVSQQSELCVFRAMTSVVALFYFGRYFYI